MSRGLLAALAPAACLSLAAPAAAAEPPAPVVHPARDLSRPVGGYWAPGERPRPRPNDGHWNIMIGSILVPLGAVGVAAAAVGVWYTAPTRCEDLTSFTAKECRGLYAFSWVRVGYSALMAVSGAAILAHGLVQRRRYRRWEAEGNFVLRPGVLPLGGGMWLGARF
jgi:hypothetical protein